MKIIIKHAWLNLKRNKWNDLLIGFLFVSFLTSFFFLLQVYTATDYSLVELKKQTDAIVTIDPNFQADKHAAKLKEVDYQQLTQLPYVRKIHLSGYTVVTIADLVSMDSSGTQGAMPSSGSARASFADNKRVGLTILDDMTLKKVFSGKVMDRAKLEGAFPYEQGTCLVTKQFAKTNQLKLKNELTIGDRKVKIVGIVDLADQNIQGTYGELFINLATYEYLDEVAENTFLTLELQLDQRKNVANLQQKLKQLPVFDNYRMQSGQLFMKIFETFSNSNESWLNGTIVMSLITLIFIGAGYWQLFRQRQSDTYALRLMGIRPQHLIFSNLLEVMLIALISVALANTAASFSSGIVAKKWLRSLAQASRKQVPLLNLKQVTFGNVELRHLVLASSETKLALGIYLLVFLLLILALTSYMLYVFGHYSLHLGRASKK